LFMTLERQHSGRTFEVAKGNYIALRFPRSTGALGFEVSPPEFSNSTKRLSTFPSIPSASSKRTTPALQPSPSRASRRPRIPCSLSHPTIIGPAT
jgi:hypothetical protein